MRRLFKHASLVALLWVTVFLFSVSSQELRQLGIELIQSGGDALLEELTRLELALPGGDRLMDYLTARLLRGASPAQLRPAQGGQIRPDRIPVIFIHGLEPLNAPNPFQEPGPGGESFIARLARLVPDWTRFQALVYTYSSWDPLEQSAHTLRELLARSPYQGREVVLIGFSVGGLIARAFDTWATDYRVLSLVMIATPNAGTPVAQRLRALLARRRAHSRADSGSGSDSDPDPDPDSYDYDYDGLVDRFAALLSDHPLLEELRPEGDFYRRLAPPRPYYTAIAGDYPYDGGVIPTLFAQYFDEEPNDGLVSVASVAAGLPPGRTVAVFPHSHLTLLRDEGVLAAVAQALTLTALSEPALAGDAANRRSIEIEIE